MMRALPLLILLLTCTLGCGDTKTKVGGTVIMKGQALSVSRKNMVTIKFVPDVEQAMQTYIGVYQHDTGQYEVELPPGKYKVVCTIFDDENKKRIPTAGPKVVDLTSARQLDLDITPSP